jgi:hypothetical protein
LPQLAVLLALAAPLGGCGGGATAPSATDPRPTGAVVAEAVEATAVVRSVDLDSRLVSLQAEDGRLITLVAGPEVRNLAQVEPGDTVVVTFVEGIVARLADEDSTEEVASAVVRAPEGGLPGAALGTAETTVVTLLSYDVPTNRVTFTGSDGLVRSLVIRSPDMQNFARSLEPGDQVEVTFTEALAITVERVAP